jgi:hypothetical protein
VEYSPFNSKLKITKEKLEQVEANKNSPDFYQQAPFLTIAEDLLKLIKEDKVEKLIFLSAYDKRKIPSFDGRKIEIFKDTYEKFDDIMKYLVEPIGKDTKSGSYLVFDEEKLKNQKIMLRLIPFDSETQGQSKVD